MVIHYKCPNCGADMNFDASSGHLHCSSCNTSQSIENMAGDNKGSQDAEGTYDIDDDDLRASEEGFENNYSSSSNQDIHTHHHAFTSDDANEFECNNCGAVLVTDKQTVATTCSFCGAGVVLSERVSGSYAPAKVVPFTITKDQAQAAFKKWCKNGLLTPTKFKNGDRIKEISGIYIPFWLYDLNGRGEAEATATRVRTYTRGDWIYTETKYYHIYRKVDLDYLRIPVDGSSKMDDAMMDKLEPFNYNDLKDFQTPYLAGYLAEKYDQDDKTLLPRVKSRVNNYVDQYINSTIMGYSSVSYNRKDINIYQRHVDYTLLPIWMVCYDYNKAQHNFAMNGQTGKIVGKPPISFGKVAAWFGGVSAATFLLLQLITLVMKGGVL